MRKLSVQKKKMPSSIIDQRAIEAAKRSRSAGKKLRNRSFWPLKMFTAINLFLWHLDAFKKDENPIPLFVDIFDRATKLLEAADASNLSQGYLPHQSQADVANSRLEDKVSGIFSEIWIGLSTEIYCEKTMKTIKNSCI